LVGIKPDMELSKDLVIDNEVSNMLSNGIYPPIFHKYNKIGLYVMRFFKDFKWIYVLIDDRVPVDSETKQPNFNRNSNLLMQLIEKACAKLNGSYKNLNLLSVNETLHMLTSFQ